MAEELTAKKRAALNRLKTVRGHLDGIIRMLEADAYCVDVVDPIPRRNRLWNAPTG